MSAEVPLGVERGAVLRSRPRVAAIDGRMEGSCPGRESGRNPILWTASVEFGSAAASRWTGVPSHDGIEVAESVRAGAVFELSVERTVRAAIVAPAGVQGDPWSGDARGEALSPAGGLGRREMSAGERIQTRTTCRMPPHQPAGTTERVVSPQRRFHKADARYVPRFLSRALWRQGVAPLTSAAVARWV